MNLPELATRIRAAGIRLRYTLERPSELSGPATGWISRIENFRVTPSLLTLAKLGEALGVSLAGLLDGIERAPKSSFSAPEPTKRAGKGKQLGTCHGLGPAGCPSAWRHKRPTEFPSAHAPGFCGPVVVPPA